MDYLKNKTLLGVVVTVFGAILISIWSDVVPSAMPALKDLPIELYIKIILLLLLLLVASILGYVLYIRTKDYRPRTMKGRFSGINWIAEIDYRAHIQDIGIDIHWLCPKHRTFLGAKDAEVPNCCYRNLFCRKCDELYELKSAGDTIYLEEAQSLIRQEILGKIRIKSI